MSNYIDVLLTKDGYFCVAPPWTVKEGDLVTLENAITGETPQEVIAVSTDEVGGDQVKMLEKYIGYSLPRVTARYLKDEVKWDELIQK